MKKNKIFKYILIALMSIIILIPSIYAKTITTTYDNYYFFLEQYTIDNLNDTTNYTAFPPISKFGVDEVKSAEEVCLVRTKEEINEKCSKKQIDNDLVWTYSEYYEMYNKTETNKNSITEYYIINGVEHNSKVYKEKNTSYYTHGSYSSDKGNSWKVNLNNSLFQRYNYNDNYNLLACASIRTTNSLAPIRHGDYLYIKIVRDLGEYRINDSIINLNSNITNCPTEEIYKIHNKEQEQYNILSPVLYKYTYEEKKEVCDPNLTKPNNGKCNYGNNVLSSTCQKETITSDNSRTDITINQTGRIANILTPDSVYQGGGFKLAFVYYNEISWDFAGEVLTTLNSQIAAKNEITSEMKKKIQSLEDFQNNVILDSISFGSEEQGSEILNSSLIQKKCERNGEFNSGETVTTVCTFYLPNSQVDSYTGIATYNNSIGTNYKVNNKYYTPLAYKGEYNIKATLKNLSTLKDDEEWTGDWSLTFDGTKDESCQINVYGRLYNKPKYIYRPIDLSNPFPSRNAGINWYDWYNDNKYDLENSYDNLEYSFILDNEKLSSIKKYNNEKNIDGTGYFNWEDIKKGESSFINEYAEKVGDNS